MYAQNLALANLFNDGMVLQQGISCPLWGYAAKNQIIEIKINNKTVTTKSDDEGKWLVKLPVFKAGGPYTLTIEAAEKITVENVMFGEVWLASGQSNMNFSIDRPILNYKEVADEANYPMIRMLTIEPSVSSYPLDKAKTKGWVVCSPQTVEKFSAVAYFFARKLHQEKQVAVGIIHSSYSGSPAESWLSKDMLSTDSIFKKQIDLLQNERENWAELQEQEKEISIQYNELVKTASNGLDSGFHQLKYIDKHWKKANFPITAAKLKLPGYRLIWLRKVFYLNDEPKNDYEICLGEIKMRDRTYVNGVLVGEVDKEQERIYTIPKTVLKKGENVIAIRWLSEWSYGRVGDSNQKPVIKNLNSGEEISLLGEWKYNASVEPELRPANSYHRNPTAIFNAMIAPIATYGIKGMLWYQGESNAGKANQYARLIQLMIKDWRNRWGQGDIPFFIVQLPNYEEGGMAWVRLREAQANIAKNNKNTFLVTTIDVGDPNDLHPKNKLPIGERLYNAAAKYTYKDKVIADGPILKKTYLKNGALWLEFSNAAGLSVGGKGLGGAFMVAGEDQKFVKANAVIFKNKVKLESEIVKPIAVRYNWEANPSAYLYNNAGLPAAPFRTDNWEY
ncbi:sialate O-acetylesterase [Pedobacter cryophilus]|uniref:Sialate O-acetylesterase n=1 Tax=Pedobacter cryophilus TaxID=2571271 RepID=A0A4U1BWZ9_9SPHI|nr:sialate O-acetylesterase [Pedobacter cryophilus]TKB96874.1 sialate O-acetylesterase [Pedobacter cryophilus]